MMIAKLLRVVGTAAILMAGANAASLAQTAPDPHHPEGSTSGTAPSTADRQNAPPGGPGTMMGPMMGPGMMGGMMGPQMGGAMPMMGRHTHMMKVMFAIADADGDGALTFQEVTAIHQRIFKAVDANKDGKVTPDEARAFMTE
jgi:predicted lipid-binding transport protein (Tim44 family)